jgi:hypothetical protein
VTGALPVFDALSGWQLAPEPPPPLAAYLQEVLVAELVDEVSGLPPQPPPDASTTTSGLAARSISGGYAGLVGQPLTLVRPGFVTGAPLQLSLSGTGFLPLSLTAKLGPEVGYPDAFAPVDLGQVAPHRTPLTVIGRVVSPTGAPLAGALVSIDGIWIAASDLANPAAAPNMVALLSPLYADRGPLATVAAQSITFAPPAQAKTLLVPGNVGDTSVRLSDQVGLAPGTLIALFPQDPGRVEYATVTAITDGGIPPNQPATAALAFPLSRPHAAGQTVIGIIPGATGAANALARTARAGDVTLFPATMTALGATMTAVVISGGPAAEYHPASTYVGTSDGNGHVVLPAVHRIAQLRLRVHHVTQPTDLLPVAILPFAAETLTLNLAYR